MPSSKRPPDTAWNVAAMLASTPGGRLATLRTSGPSISRWVMAASAVSTVHASGTPEPSGASVSRRWSHVHSPSNPAASAASAAARMGTQRALIGIRSRSIFTSAQHRLRDARQLGAHLDLAPHGRRAHDDAGGARVVEAPDEIAIGRLAVDRDRERGGIAAGLLRQAVERR